MSYSCAFPTVNDDFKSMNSFLAVPASPTLNEARVLELDDSDTEPVKAEHGFSVILADYHTPMGYDEEDDEDANDENWRKLGKRLAAKHIFADSDDDECAPCSFCTLFVSCMSCSMALSTAGTGIKSIEKAAAADEVASTAPPSPANTTMSVSSNDLDSFLESSDESAEELEDSDNDEDWRALGKKLAEKRIFLDVEDDDDF
eukprot:gnl/TRDRNA2_/TRDRNA2_178725_c0_seq1.p2 gnl/TRDRNA2_/TRDRNA2_178725_c0~~gnl/TRDRNA2_/TRDRNA2_178725_c0_seq1.p2  ORF type:complete len:202 (+),score=59.05 gnl/TRDRNA2_/TRDRNA2_178725_c0_seq1:173-778(+)